jgi:hypothetical protein
MQFGYWLRIERVKMPDKSIQPTRDGGSSSASRFTLTGSASLSLGRWGNLRVKVLIAGLVMVTWAAARGSEQGYFSARKWIEQQCATNATPPDHRLFVGRMETPRYADIVPFHKGITIREIIDRTPLKGKIVQICVMWPDRITKSGVSFTRHKYITVRPFDTPDYEVKN